MNSYICDYADFMKNTGRKSVNTVESYTRDIIQYTKFLTDLGITDIKNTTKTTVTAYITELHNKGRSNATVSRMLAAVRSFYVFLMENGKISDDPTAELSMPHIEKKPPMVLSGDEIELLLSQPKLTDSIGIRDKAMLELLYATGIRVSELIGLDVTAIDLTRGFVRCKNNRGERTIPLGAKAVDALRIYTGKARMGMLAIESEQALFVNRNGSRISRQGFWKIIKKYKESAGIKQDITPHSLRHSFAAHLIENGADLESLRAMMGHADISSTQIYEAFVNDKIRNVYNKTHPRAV